MSFQTIRKHSSKSNSRVRELLDRLTRFETSQLQIEDEDLILLGFTNHSRIQYHDEIKFTKTTPINVLPYKLPVEPDGKDLTLWLRFDGLSKLEDASFYNNIGTQHGDPSCSFQQIVEGMDEGINMGGGIAVRFDGKGQHVTVLNSQYIDLIGDTVGFSIFMRFNVISVNQDSILFQKIDNSTPTYGFEAWLSASQQVTTTGNNFDQQNFDLSFGGTETAVNYLPDNYDDSYGAISAETNLHFMVKWNGTVYSCETSGATIITGNWYDAWFIFDKVNLTCKIYLNNVLYNTPSLATTKLLPGADTALHIGSSDNVTVRNNGLNFFNGYVQDFRFWNEKLKTATEVNNQWINKLTVSNISFNKSGVIGYSIIPQAAVRKLTETVSVSDSVSVTKTVSNPIVRTIVENVSVSDSVSVQKNPVKIPSRMIETVPISDSATAQKLSLFAKVGQFQKSTQTTGLPFTQSIVGLGFTPKFIIFWGANNTDLTGKFAEHYDFMFGFSDGTNDRGFSISSLDNVGTSSVSQMWYNNTINDTKTSPTILYQANCTFDNDGFTLHWTTMESSPAHIINYLAVGGNNITNAEVGGYAMPATATGNHSKTGLSFKPDAVMFIPTNYTTNNNIGNKGTWSLGFARSATQAGLISNFLQDNVGTSNTARYMRFNKAVARLNDSAETILKEADFVQFNNDGWTLNFTTNGGAADMLNYLAFKGANVYIGKFAITSGVGLQSITGVGFKPKVVMAWTHNVQTQGGTATTGQAKYSFGAATDSLSRYSASAHDRDGQSTTQNITVTHSNKFIKTVDAHALAADTEINCECDFVSMTNDGFDINKLINDGSSREVLYMAIGGASSGAGTPPSPPPPPPGPPSPPSPPSPPPPPTVDQFGITMLKPTKSGGRTYYSNWHTATSHTWDSGGQIPHINIDPQDSLADLIAPSTCRATVDATTDTLTADTNSDRNSWRYYILDPACTAASSPWKWGESVEMTVYYKALQDYSGGSIHVHCRLMGPTEHWNAITDDNVNACETAGHEYGFEIKRDGTIQLRKELVHPAYADNKISATDDAPYNIWIGMKLVVQKQGTKMKVEGYRDLTDGLNGGTWVKMIEFLDDGTNWLMTDAQSVSDYNAASGGTGNCTKMTPKERMLDIPASAVGIRVDNTQVQLKKFSVREIPAI